jgi:hypothetical protein
MSPISSIPYVPHEKYSHSRSASTIGQYARTQKLEQNYKVLQRKYGSMDKLYKEARRQNEFLKDQLEKKTEQWREWHNWFNVQRQSLRVKSTSPAKNQRDRDDEMIAMKDGEEAQGEVAGRTDVRTKDPEENDNEEAFFRTTFSPDAVATRRDTQSMVSPEIVTVKPQASNEHTISPQQKVNLPINTATSDKRKSKSAAKDAKEPHLLPDNKELNDMQDVQATSKPSEKTEILVIPESPVTYQGRISILQNAHPIPFEPSPRPKSASIQHSRASNSSTPLSTRSSGEKKKKREYPNMKYWTEDGTDGINPVHSSLDDDDGGGLLMAMLEGPPPGPPGIASPLPLAKKKPSPSKSETAAVKNETTAKEGRVRELIEIESDGESEGVSTPELKRQKVKKAQSEPRRLRREILSPDLASKNKGRGRYSTSLPKRYCPYYSI